MQINIWVSSILFFKVTKIERCKNWALAKIQYWILANTILDLMFWKCTEIFIFGYLLAFRKCCRWKEACGRRPRGSRPSGPCWWTARRLQNGPWIQTFWSYASKQKRRVRKQIVTRDWNHNFYNKRMMLTEAGLVRWSSGAESWWLSVIIAWEGLSFIRVRVIKTSWSKLQFHLIFCASLDYPFVEKEMREYAVAVGDIF